MNACYVGIYDVRDAEYARKRAMREFITGHGKLLDEFTKEYGNDILSLDVILPEYHSKLDEFADKRGFKIVRERPFVNFDERLQEYHVDICYTIEYV